ncbi:MAG: type II secretion system GspH family protein [Kiritimatiellae bacterium]|nr:type II secretion system GspH family protein [Kiritimatiellia bacterium]
MTVRWGVRRGGRSRRSRRGLTLIETLLAIAILGIALSVLVAAAGQALGVVRRARNLATARHLLDIVELENPILDLAEAAGTVESGGFDPPYDAYTWERSVEPMLDLMGEETDYYVIRTRLRWSERGRESYEEVVTGAYAPTETAGVAPDAEAMDAETGGADGAVGGGLRAPAPVGGRGRRDGRDPRNGAAGPGEPPAQPGVPGGGGPRAAERMPRAVRDFLREAFGRGAERRGGAPVRPPPGSGRAGAGRAFTAGREPVGGAAAGGEVATPRTPRTPRWLPPPSPGGFDGGPPPPPGF